MSRNIVTIEDFAKELERCVSCDFFSVKELKSLANSIKWPYRFFKVSSKLRLKEEMTYLCAFLGCSALKFSTALGFLEEVFATDASQLYIERLTLRWLLERDIPKCRKKVADWESLGLVNSYTELCEAESDEAAEPYLEVLQTISEDFYISLTGKQCNEFHKWCLYRRFNLYFGHFIEIIDVLTKKAGLVNSRES